MDQGKQYENSEYDSSLESDAPMARTGSASAITRPHSNPLKFDRKAVLITGVVVSLVLLIGLVTLVAGNTSSRKQVASEVGSYKVGPLAVKGVAIEPSIQIGKANHLEVNGQLQVNSTIVITPTNAPASPTAGQIYYDQNSNQPYYYNGTEFVSLAPRAVPLSVTSIGGASGVVRVGTGLQLIDGQLGLSANSLAALASGGVTSLQGKTGAVNFTGAAGISINGTTIANTGVINLTSTASQISITQDGAGGYTLGGNVLGGTGASSQIALFTGGSTLSGSILSQSGGTVTAGGNLTVTGAITSSSVVTNSITQTAVGSNVNISAGADAIVFTAGGRTFTLPTNGVSSQTICTSSVSCTSGGGAAVVLQPGAVQADGGAGSSIAINNTGGGTLLQLQSNGSNVFVVNNNGSLNTLTVAGASTFNGAVGISGNNSFTVGTGATALGGTLGVTGATSLSDALAVTGNTTVGGTLDVTGVTTLSTLNVSANTALTGTLGITGASTFSTGTFSGLGTFNAGLTVSNSNFIQTGTGTLSTGSGAVTLNGNTSVSGTNTFTTGSGAVKLGSLGAGLVQSDSTGVLSSGIVDRNSTNFNNTLSVANGGTGAATFTSNGLLYGNATGAVQATVAGTAGQILLANALGVPTFTSLGGDAGIDSSGALTISKLQGTTLTISSLAAGQVVQYNGAGFVNGLITNTNLQAGNFTNITGTGALANGSITTGFGAITIANNITTSATVQGATVKASGALQGNTLSVSGFTVDATGAISAVSGIASSGGYTQTGASLNTFSGATTFTSDLAQTGSGTFSTGSGAVSLNGNTTIAGSSTFATGTGSVSLNGATTVGGSNTFSVGSGATSLGGTLGVTGAATFVNNITVQGGNVTIGTTGVNGLLKLTNSTNANLTAIQALAPSGSGTATIQIPSIAGGGSDQVCLLSLANCAGAGSGVTYSVSSAGYIPVFSSAQNITNSILYQTGTSVGINTGTPGAYALNVQGGNVNFAGNATVGSGLNVTGATSLNGAVSVSGTNTFSVGTGATTLGGSLGVTGATSLSSVSVSGISALGATTVGSTLGVTGATTVTTLSASGTASFSGTISQTGAVSFSTGTGAVNLNGNTTIAGGKNFAQTGAGTFDTGTGTVNLNGNTSVTGSNTFAVGTGGITDAGALAISGASTLAATAITGITTINTTGTASTAIGNPTGSFSLNSSGLNVTTAGATSGITTLAVSGAISGATTGNTINGLIINGGALTGVTGINTSGAYTQTGVGANAFSGTTTFTGAGTALTVNNNATISGTASIGTLSVGTGGISDSGVLTVSGTGASSIAGQLSLTAPGIGLNVSNNATIGGTLAIQGANGLTIGTAGSITGSLALANSTNTNLGVLQAAAASGIGNATYTLPSIAGGGIDTVCLQTLANCSGSPSSVTTSTDGTVNQLAKFTGAHTIANSSISDDGTTVTVTEVLSAATISTGTIQSTGTLAITPGGNLTIGTTNQKTTLQGNSSSTIAISASGFTTTVGFTAPTANRSITFPDEGGVVCLRLSTNCGFATAGAGVTTLDTLAGALTIGNTTGAGSVITINNASTTQKGIAQFNASDFSDNGAGIIDTIQGITTTSAVQFGSLTLGTGGNLTLSDTGKVITNNITSTGSADLSFDALTNSFKFTANGGTNSFQFPTSGGLGQVICTSGISCASGGGQAVILEPSAIQTANGNKTAILINKASGTGNLLQLQSGGTDDLIIDNSGNTTISKIATITDLRTNSITPSAALSIGATSQQFTLQGTTSGSSISFTDSGLTASLGSGRKAPNTAPTGSVVYQLQNDSGVTPGTYFVCTTAGNCAGTGGSVTTTGGTPGQIAKFTASGNIADSIIAESAGVITVGGSLNVGTSGSATLTLGVASTTNGSLVFKNSTNGNSITLVPSAPASNTTVTLPNASGTVAVSASGPIALDPLTGQISCSTCLTSGGSGGTSGISNITGTTSGSVAATGALTFNNALTTATSITIDNASTTVKGIASFNATNFSAASGAINTVQDINSTASPTFANLSLQGTTGLSLGSAANIGQLAFKDGTADGFSLTFTPATLTANRTITVPNNSGTVAVAASGNALLSATGVVSITNSPTFTTSVTTPSLLSSGALSITSAGQLSIGVSSQTLALIGSTSSTIAVTSGSFTSTLGFTAPTANRTLTFPDATGTVCLQLSANCGFALATNVVNTLNGQTGTLSVANASAAAGVITIDNATTAAKGIASFNATNFTVSSGAVNTIQDIATTATPSFAGETIGASGLTVNGSTTLNGNTSVSSTNTFTVGTGATALGGTLNVAGLATLAATTLVGAANINTTGTANTSIGNATGTFSVNSAALKVTTAGALSGITTLNLSGVISGATSGNTINGLIINSGALSGVTGYAQTSGNFSQGGGGTFDTASGQVNLNGNTAVTGSNTFNVGTGTTTLGGALNVAGTGTFTSQLNAGSSNQFQVNASGNVTSGLINGQTISSAANFTGSVAIQGAAGLTLGVASTTAGSLTFANATSGRTVSLQALSPTGAGNVSLIIPAVVGGTSDEVCLKTTANCTGTGGGASATGYSANYVTKFTGTTNQITASQLFDNGSFVGVNTTSANGQLSVVASGTSSAFFAQGATTGSSAAAIIKSGGSTGDLLDFQPVGSTTPIAKIDANGSATFVDLNITGNFAQTGAGTFGTGTGAVSLNGNTSVANGSSFTTGGSGAVTLGNVASGLVQSVNGLLSGGTINRNSSTFFNATALTVANGGTGLSSLTTNSILYATGTGTFGQLAGTGGQLLLANSGGTPTFTTLTGDATLNSSGSLTVSSLQGNTLTITSPATGQYLRYNGAAFVNSALGAADITGTLFSLAATSGTTQAVTTGQTITIARGGSNNLTTTAGASNTVTVDIISNPTFTGAVTAQGAGGISVGVTGTTQGVVNLATTGAGTVSLKSLAQAANLSLNIPVDGNATDTICLLTLANCSGSGLTSSTGAANYVARFTGATTLGIGKLYDSGTSVGVNNISPAATNLLSINSLVTAASGAQVAVATAAAGNVGLLVQGFGTNTTPNQTADLAQFQSSTGAVLANIDGAGNVVLGSTSSLKLTGSASFPASPTEGQVYFRTDTKQLYVYSNGKWTAQAGGTATILVAASNSANKEKADYVATGTNDQNTINTALSALPAGGGQVFLLDGTFSVSGSINVPNNTLLSGSGAATLITVPNAQNGSYNIIANSDTSTGTHVTIQNLQIDGNKANQSSGTMFGIYLNGMGGGSGTTARDGAKVSNVTVRNIFGSVGIALTNSSNNTLNGNTVQGNSGQGIALVTSSSNNTLIGNTAQGNGGSGFITSTSATGNTFTGNTAQGNTANGFNINTTNNTITSNSASGNGAGGILVNGASGNTVTGNTAQGNTGYGISLTTATNSTVTGNTAQGNTGSGISLSNSSNNVLSTNKIHDNGGATAMGGIFIGSVSTSNSIIGNDITDTSCTSSCNAIIINGSTAVGNYLADNHYSGSAANVASIGDTGTGTIYADQQDANGNLLLSGQAGVGINTTSPTASLQNAGGFINSALAAPAAPTVTAQGGGSGTSYTYVVTATDGIGETVASGGTVVSSAATLNGSQFNRIVPARVSGAVSYKIYRTASAGVPATTGLIGTLAGGAATFQFDDTGLAGTTAAPASNTTGGATIAGALTVGGTLGYTGSGAFAIQSAGGITLGSSTVAALKVTAQAAAASAVATIDQTGSNVASIGLVVKGVASQTGDLQQFQNSSSQVLSRFTANGQLVLGGTTAGSQIGQLSLTDGTNDGFTGTIQLTGAIGSNQTYVLPASGGTICTVATCTGSSSGSGNGSYIQNGTALQTNANLNIQSASSGSVVAILRAASGQSVDLLQFQNSSANSLGGFNANGDLRVGSTSSASSTTALSVNNTAGTNIFNVDTTAGQTTLRGTLSDGTISAELLNQAPPNNNFNSATYWTGTTTGGFTSTATVLTGLNTNSTASTTSSDLTIVAGKTYQVTYTIGGSFSGDVLVSLGGSQVADTFATGTFSYNVTTSNTSGLSFFGGYDVGAYDNTFSGTISNVSVKLLTASTPILQAKNSSGTVSLEVRAPSASYATFIGYQAGQFTQSTTYSDTGIGYGSLAANLTGSANTAIGYQTLNSNVSGSNNQAFGPSALRFNTSGTNNIGIGFNAVVNNTTGNSNIGIGTGALGVESTTSNNVAIGFGAGGTTSGSGSVFIGNYAGGNEGGGNKLYIANSNTITPLIGGDFSTAQLTINGYQTIQGTGTSSGSLKIVGGSANPANLLEVGTTAVNPVTNMLTNSGFEGVGSSPWFSKGVGTTRTQAAPGYSGAYSMQVTTGSANSGLQASVALLANTTYTFSLYMEATGSSFSTINVGHQDVSGTDIDCLTSQTLLTTGFQRYSCTFTTGATVTSPNVYFKDTSTSHVYQVDAVLLTTGTTVLPYDGFGTAIRLNGVIDSPTIFRNGYDSTTAFQIQNAAGTSNILVADTLNNRLNVGTLGTPTSQLYVAGTVSAGPLSSLNLSGGPGSVATQGRYAYVANYGNRTIQVIDISNPASPSIVGTSAVQTSGVFPRDIVVSGRYAYVGNIDISNGGQIIIYDISNPTNPVSVSSYIIGVSAQRISVAGRYLYVSTTNINSSNEAGIKIFDVGNPNQITATASIENATYYGGDGIFVKGRYLYQPAYDGSGPHLLTYDISNPGVSVSLLNASSALSTGNNPTGVYVQGSYAYIADYTGNKLLIVNISNPTSPTLTGSVALSASPFSVNVQGRYAYVATGSNTLTTIDVSNPAAPLLIGSTALGASADPRVVTVQGRYAYMAGYSSSNLYLVHLGGAYVQQLEVGSIETNTLVTKGDANISGSLSLQGGLSVSQSSRLNGDVGVNGQLKVTNTSGSIPAFIVQGSSSQSANLLQLQTSTGTVVGSVSASGAVLFQNSTNSTTALQVANAAGGVTLSADTTNNQLTSYGSFNLSPTLAPGSISSVTTGAAGSLAGTFYYVVSFVTASGETEYGAQSSPAAPISQQVNLSGIPTSSSSLVTARKIYRGSTGGPYYLVTTINNNTTTTYTDNSVSAGAVASNINRTAQLKVDGTPVFNSTNSNLLIGRNTGNSNATGSSNVFVGLQTGLSNITGNSNTATGSYTFQNNTSGNYNTATGYAALFSNTVGSNNSASGVSALGANTTGYYNSANGYAALGVNTTGSYNTASGYNAGYGDVDGFYTSNALQNATVIGANAQVQSSNSLILGSIGTSGTTNVGIGTTQALNILSVEAIDYSTGTVSQSGFTVTGTGTTFTSAMVGDQITFQDSSTGGYTAETITGYVSATQLTASISQTIPALSKYRLHKPGLQVTSAGKVGIGTTAPTANLQVTTQTNTATAFQVQNAAGTGVLTVDTLNGQTILKNATTAGDAAIIGSELLNQAPPNNNFNNATYWTCSTGWTRTATTATHTTGNTNTCATTASDLTIVAGNTYQISYTTSGTFTATDYVYTNIGGVIGTLTYGSANQIEVVTATTTGGLIFTPSSAWAGSISNVSVKLVAQTSAALQVKTSTNVIALEVRAVAATRNTLIGVQTGQTITSGMNNTGIGYSALQNTTTGTFNTAIGTLSLQKNTTGGDNVAIGAYGLQENTTGSDNVAIGLNTLSQSRNSSFNVAIGAFASNALKVGVYNVAIGASALSISNGNENVSIGSNSGYISGFGSTNSATFIGSYAGGVDPYAGFYTTDNLTNITALGYASVVQASNSLILGGQGVYQANVGIGTTNPTNLLSVSPDFYDAGGAGTGGVGSTTVIGSGTLWTAAMVGSEIVFQDGQKATITVFNSATSLTVSPSVSEANGSTYRIHLPALQVTASGRVGIGTVAPTARLQIANRVTTDVAQIIQGASGQTADLLQLQNSTGTTVLAKFDASGGLFLGAASSTTGSLTLANAASAFSGTLSVASLTAARTYTLPDASGTICIVGAASCSASASGGITNGIATQAANFNIQSNIGGSVLTTTPTAVIKAAGTQTGDLLQLQDSSANVLTKFTVGGDLAFNHNATLSNAIIGTANAIGYNLSIAAGAANGSTTGNTGGALSLQGGNAAGSGNNNGGAVTIGGGVPTNAGTYGALNLQTTGGNINIGAATSTTTFNGIAAHVSTATTATVLSVAANSLTSGAALNVSSSSTAFTTGTIANFDGSATYATSNSAVNNSVTKFNRTITANTSGSTPTLDSSTPYTNSSTTTSDSFTHTSGNGANRVLIIGTENAANSGGTSSVTYNGVGLTLIGEVLNGSINTDIWELIAPPVGTYTVVVNHASSASNNYIAETFNGVNQTTPNGAYTSTTGSTSTQTITPASAVGDLVIDFNHYGNFTVTPAAGGGQTSIQSFTSASRWFSSSYKTGAAGTTTMTWTEASSSIASSSGFALKPAAGAGGVVINNDLTSFTSNCSITAGSCTDATSIINLNQQYASATGAVIKIQNAGTGADLQLGNGRIRPTTDSTTAIQFQNANGSSNVITLDTSNTRVGIGNSATGSSLLQIGTNTTSSTGGIQFGTDSNSTLYRSAANTLTFGGLVVVSGNLTATNGTILSGNTTGTLFNTTATTVNAFGAATAINIGAAAGSTLTAGGALSITNATPATANAIGNALTLQAGAANGSTTGNTGGALSLQGGNAAGSGTFNGGAVSITGGATSVSSSGTPTGGAVTITGGLNNSAGGGNGGTITIQGGNDTSSFGSNGGSVNINAGTSSNGSTGSINVGTSVNGPVNIGLSNTLAVTGGISTFTGTVVINQTNNITAGLSITGSSFSAASGNGVPQTAAVLSAIGGNGGATFGTTSTSGGVGAGAIIQGGNGGAATGATGTTSGGNGGALSFTSGAGGNVTSATGTAGSGGLITLQGGAAGIGGSTAGSRGSIGLQAAGGNVGIGTNSPTNKLTVNALTTSNASTLLGQVAISSGAAANIGQIIQGVASQTADLAQFQNSTGAVLSRVDSYGNLRLNNSGSSTITDGAVVLGQIGYKSTYLQDFYGSSLFLNNASAKNSGGSGVTRDQTGVVIGVTLDTGSFNVIGAPTGAAGSAVTLNSLLNISNTGAATFKNTTDSTTAFQIQNSAGTTSAVSVDTTNLQTQINGNSNGYNTTAGNLATLFVGKDTSGTPSNRSINAAGSINASGADYAEYIPYSGIAPLAGSIVSYQGSNYIVSSKDTAAFVGNDAVSGTPSILVTFAGQVPVRVTGAVNVGDILISNGDGTAKAVSPASASIGQLLSKIAIAQASATGTGVNTVQASVGTTSDSIATALQNQSSSFNDVSVLGTASINNLNVSGATTLQTLQVMGSADIAGNLGVTGDITVKGSVNVGGDLGVTGNLTVAGLTNVQDIIVNGHIISANSKAATKATTSVAAAAAACTAGTPTVTMTGNDTAGTVTITTGTGACDVTGALATVTFATGYGTAPAVTLTPANAAAASLQYYYSSDTSTMTLNTSVKPAASTTYSYSYHVIQ